MQEGTHLNISKVNCAWQLRAKFEFWANLLDFGQLGRNAERMGDGLDALNGVSALSFPIEAAELIAGEVQLCTQHHTHGE